MQIYNKNWIYTLTNEIGWSLSPSPAKETANKGDSVVVQEPVARVEPIVRNMNS